MSSVTDKYFRHNARTQRLRKRQPFNPDDVEINAEFREALTAINDRRESCFITGAAGTGKSTLLKFLRARSERNMVVLAPTGVAAVNVEGQTIHSFFGFPPRLIDPASLRKIRNGRIMKKLDLLIIDEISMVRAELLDAVDQSLRINRGKLKTPFGGVQVVFFGDVHQLAPVVEAGAQNYFDHCYEGVVFFFAAKVFDDVKLSVIEMVKPYRQRDPDFLSLLGRMRHGGISPKDIATINDRVGAHLAPPFITLTATNATADARNQQELSKLSGREYVYRANVTGTFDPKSFPTDSELRLKVGATVMLLRNDPEKRWVNGDIGLVHALDDDEITVNLRGEYYPIARAGWEKIAFDFDRKENRITENVVGQFEQFPLRLAWAITIHKSQGQTFERAEINLGNRAFAHGQVYVALSRCKSLRGVALTRPLNAADIIVDRDVGRMNEFLNRKSRLV